MPKDIVKAKKWGKGQEFLIRLFSWFFRGILFSQDGWGGFGLFAPPFFFTSATYSAVLRGLEKNVGNIIIFVQLENSFAASLRGGLPRSALWRRSVSQ